MQKNKHKDFIKELKRNFSGDIFSDELHILMYATDASIYREKPLAVCYPQNTDDIKNLVQISSKYNITIIPRTAGTSLAGQVVGKGIIADVSKHFTKITDINCEDKKVTVQPGVILDELNKELKHQGLFFAPETSTGNRCMLGGMIGNNSCGANSMIYGTTREHLLAVDAVLSDGSEVSFSEISESEFKAKCELSTLEGKIYRFIYEKLSDDKIQKNIREQYPSAEIKRRNTGYAMDTLLNMKPFTPEGPNFNMAKLIAGSEGTLSFITSATLNLETLPPPLSALLCVHFNTVEEALEANLITLVYNVFSVELIDGKILELTKLNPTQNKNRFFLKDNPGAVLIIEFKGNSTVEIEENINTLIASLQNKSLGYHFPVVSGDNITKVWNLRKAGLGLLSNMPGDAKPVSVIEDTAVKPEQLADYVHLLNQILKKYKVDAVYYGHAKAGLLHVKPVLNLKVCKDVELLRKIAYETALLVKKFGGSLSGEHGDGRLRGEFIPFIIGKDNYQLLVELKKVWDENEVFNRGKITSTPPMDTFLRYDSETQCKKVYTYFDFTEEGGILSAIEKCNGSADCRKTHHSGGTMCPSYMATLDEKNSTRARANILREYLTYSKKKNPFNNKEIFEVLELCLGCKACKSECPSNIDMTKYKAEFLQNWYKKHGVPLRTKVFSNIPSLYKYGMLVPYIYNTLINIRFTQKCFQYILGISKHRQLPQLPEKTLRQQIYEYLKKNNPPFTQSKGELVLFIDEFSNYLDTHAGMSVVEVLTKLNYNIHIIEHEISGITYLSKGLLKKAKKIAEKNINILSGIINDECPLVGIEPSSVLCFRDEYISLCDRSIRASAEHIAKNTFLFEEFIVREMERKHISSSDFNEHKKLIKMHGHCHQKALSDTAFLKKMLELPENFQVIEIKSGCCGMAGGFGYEKEHYALSMNIGELVLFPEIRKTPVDVLIVAPGISCRRQIKDATEREAFHPAEILKLALTTEVSTSKIIKST